MAAAFLLELAAPELATAMVVQSPPRSPRSRLETNLQRLLRSCEQLSEAPDDGVAQRRRLATYLSVLDRYWHELSAVPAKRQQCPPDELGEYRRRIEQLADLLDDEKLLATASSATATRTHSNSRLSREQANAELSSRLRAANRVQEALRTQLLKRDTELPPTAAPSSTTGVTAAPASDSPTPAAAAEPPTTPPPPSERPLSALGGVAAAMKAAEARGAASCRSGAAAAATGASSGGGGSSAAAAAAAAGSEPGVQRESLRRQLEAEQATQERYIADLASDVAQLKNRQLQANKALKDDSRTLDSTDRGLDQNLAQLETNRSRLGKQLQTMRSSKCWTFLMVAIVIALFVFTYLFIKLFPKPRRR